MGWCIEWLQAFFLVADDIMDGSVTRRGQPCWYLVDHVKMNACNDCILLECHIYRLLKMFVSDSRCYAKILDLFHDVTYQTSVGQMLDLITAPVGKADLSKYTLATYKNIVKYKTAFYSFVLPVCSAMLLLGIDGEREHEIAREVLLPMGEYFQVQDDYLDAFGDPEVIGKVRAGSLKECALTNTTMAQRRRFECCGWSSGSLALSLPYRGSRGAIFGRSFTRPCYDNFRARLDGHTPSD